MRYIKLHGGHTKFLGGNVYVHTCEIRKGAKMATLYEWTVCHHHVYGLDDMSVNGLYDMFVNVLDVQSINIRTCDVHGLHELFATGLKRLSINVFPRDVR